MLTKIPSRSRPRPSAPRRDHSNPPAQNPTTALLATVGIRGYLGPVTVVEVKETERLVLVRWEQAGKTEVAWARLALPGATALNRDDVALAVTQDGKDVYLIGLLSAATPPAESRDTETAIPPARDAVVQVHSRRGELVVEHHPESGKTIVNVEHGDLEFVTREGSIAFNSAQKISLNARRLETQAETLVTRAKNTYETVEELHQLQAGRTRTLVQGSCLLKAKDAFLKAETDFKIDGEQIHLG